MHKNRQILIVGPCSAESFEQLEKTLQGLDKSLFNDYDVYFRAGCWKPRTMPGQFEGYGEEALKWLQQLKCGRSIKVCTEVATIEQLQLALKYGIDAIWIGARTVTDVFAMSTLSTAIPSTLTVFVKNPISADLNLWIGGLKRLSHCENLYAIHRGFTVSEYTSYSKYRNDPKWNIVHDLKQHMPDVKVIFDPSHIAGDRIFVKSLIKAAKSSNLYDGFMIESHYNPNEALTDSKQQILPSEVKYVINQDASAFSFEREQIDEIDEKIIHLISKRFDVVKKIGKKKMILHEPIVQTDRKNELFKNVEISANKCNVSTTLVEAIYQLIHDESVKYQQLNK